MNTRDLSGSTTVDGCRVAWHQIGAGRPLVLLNGYAATKSDWDPAFLKRLGEECQLLCIDHRGMGESEPGEEEISVERMAKDVLAVIAELNLDRIPLLGWSMGGFVAQEAAALDPGRVEALVLLSTDHGGPDAVQIPPDIYAALTDQSGSPREQATRLIKLLFPPEVAERIDGEFGEIVAAARARLSPDVLTAQRQVLSRWHAHDAEQRIAALQMPALIAMGTEDVVIPPQNSDLLAARLAGAWLARFAGGGHGFMAQQPRRLATLILAFLADAA